MESLIFVLIICFLLFWIMFLLRKNSLLQRDSFLYKSQIALEEKFKNISNELLLNNHKNFINLAKDTLERALNVEKIEYEKRHSSFTSLIKPISDTLSSFDKKISEIERQRIDAYGDLRRQVTDLMLFQQEIQKETSALNKALSNPFMSGQWGEMQLRRVVEITGMMAYCDFVEQAQSETTRLRPDMVIKLPGNRNIIVDAKAPLDAYMQAMNTSDESYLDLHTKHIRSHIKSLSQKAYWEQFSPTPEFVIMFLPGESFFSSAVKKDPTLIEFGVHQNVIIATPITLIALLKAIAYSWQQEAIAANAKKIGDAGKSVYANLEKLITRFKDFEKRLNKSSEDYDKIMSFVEKTILPDAKKLKSLGLEVEIQDEKSEEISSAE